MLGALFLGASKGYKNAKGTVAADPNFFDRGLDMLKAQEYRRIQGADPNAGLSDYSAYAAQTRDQGLAAQLGALDMYQQQAVGLGGPSLAEQQMQQQGEQQMGQALALASRGRGGNVAGAQQQALAGQQYGAQQLNAQQGQLRAAEQAQAQAAAAQLGSQMYQQAQGYDQLASQQAQFNSQSALDWYLGRRGLDQQKDQANKQWMLGLTQAGAGMVGGLMGGASMMSDERVKTGISDGGMAATETVGALQPKTYEYMPGYGPPGERVGPMAQDLERTPAGASLVTNTPYGKTVDVGGLASLGVAAASENTHKLAAMEDELAQLRGMLGVQSGSTTSQQYVRNGLGGY